ncbi:DEHA2C06336p [Debaryomyces hansenii CBS767]|uniref:DEHA2C06336p n=1 Tax=Debaryomyces hansenii (strain ATCC 36239 / CBS 767 / BCRC 21394 / JCM 1990 / NBRC 0083 / IGC 2968) TaxID=284592 RepID=Q6BV07_DEBHA|nr:DEHA2C06336p [Debaryomyces hansenii CBS767]CAG86020.2 DEHA2C06336p [Debaryomyces hansenii CBS767]|eukprot:XP_457962.2 DEHA2C06336p [Debaryomyces hansenii CBS767]
MRTLDNYFSVQVFLIVLRETLESAIIISVLLAFIKQSFNSNNLLNSNHNTLNKNHIVDGDETSEVLHETGHSEISDDQHTSVAVDNSSIYNYLRLQIWIGGLLGVTCCLIIGSIILAIFYIIGKDFWSVTEHYWEGTFSILASIIISVMGIKILRVSKMQDKWKNKLSTLINQSNYIGNIMRQPSDNSELSGKVSNFSEKYAMFILPFVTTLREGMEAIVFIGGIGINENTSIWAIFNSLVTALSLGLLIGGLLYRSGNTLSLQWFLIASTGFLYLVAAGLFSKGVWNFELQRFIDLCDGFDVSETGHRPGSYDISKSIWHVNCCNGELQDDGPLWMVLTAVLGWTNSATYGSVISYNAYWITVILVFASLLFEEKHGRLPVIPLTWQKKRIAKRSSSHYAPVSSIDTSAIPRESIDSVNSKTPLNS